jgi:hypothetical protein
MNQLSPGDARRQAGSAYIIALLVLIVLTVVGLALTLITQTEVQIGATERSANRSFYASDSGPQIALAGTLNKHWDQNIKLEVNTTQQDTGSASEPSTYFADELTVTPLVQINSQPCNICDVADPQYSYKYVMHAVTGTSTRTGFIGTSPAPLVQKTIATMYGLEPWQASVFQAQSNDTTKDETLQKIKF